MFGLFAAKCPVDTESKLWIEQRLCWLAEVFGIQRMLDATVVAPSADWFPDGYEGTADDVAWAFQRLCGLAQFRCERFKLEVHDEPSCDTQLPCRAEPLEIHTGAGSGREQTIRILWQQVEDPVSLVAALAHRLAHALLLGQSRMTERVADREWVTDLATVYLGMGAFGANSAARENRLAGSSWSAWPLSGRGYLNEPQYAYALALFAWVRGERRPAWSERLRPNVREPFRQALRYLNKTGDSLFRPDQQLPVGQAYPDNQFADVLHDLHSRWPAVRLAAVRHLRLSDSADKALPALVELLHDKDVAVFREAATALGDLGKLAADAAPTLVDHLVDREPEIRKVALQTLGRIGADAERVVPEAASLLDDREREVRIQSAITLGDFGERAAVMVPKLTKLLTGKRVDAVIGPTYALGCMGLQATSAVPAIIEILYQAEGAARVAAVSALARIGHKSEAVLAALHWAVRDDDHELQHAALDALADMSPLYQESVPILTQAMRSDDIGTRERAAFAISRVDGQTGAAIRCLAESMFPPLSPAAPGVDHAFDAQSYWYVSQALREIGPEAVPHLLKMLEQPDPPSKTFALWGLSCIGTPASAGASRIQHELDAEDRATRLLATIALWNARQSAAEVVGSFVDLLTTIGFASELSLEFDTCPVDTQDVGNSTVYLGRLSTGDELTRAVVRLAIREIGEPAVAPLVNRLADSDQRICREIVAILAAVDYGSSGRIVERQAGHVDCGLSTRKLLASAIERRQQLARRKREFELMTMSLPATPSTFQADTAEPPGQIREATWLLIYGLAENAGT